MLTSDSTAKLVTPSLLAVTTVVGLGCGVMDVMLAVLQRVPSYENLLLVVPAVFAAALVPALLLLSLWSGMGGRVAAWCTLSSGPLLVAIATAITTLFLSFRIGEVPLGGLSIAQLLLLLLFAAMAVALGIGAYFAAATILAQPRLRAPTAAALLIVPAVLFELLVFVWVQLYWIESAKSVAGELATAVLLVVVAGTLWISFRRMDGRAAWRTTCAVTGAVVAIPLLMIASAGWSAWTNSGRTDHPIRHVVLISADTLRADALATYGNPRVATPALDKLASDGIVFENVISVAPWTLPSIATLMTGVAPAVHLVEQESARLPLSVATLAERFAAAGYHTGAIVDNPYLRPKSNLDQGFSDYIFISVPGYGHSIGALLLRQLLPGIYRPERPSTPGEQTDRVLRWLDRNADRDFFLWIHYFDPHTPYEPRHDYVPGTPPPGMGYSFSPPPQVMSGLIARSDADKAWIRALYEGEVRGIDDNVGRVLDKLRTLDLYDESVIAFTSDHGEELWEHGAHGHGHALYNEHLHVPLILKQSHGKGGARVAARVSNERIDATLLESADVEFDASEMSGTSLLPLLAPRASTAASPPIISATSIIVDDLQSVIFEDHKFIRSRTTGREQLFDLHTDAGEHISRIADLPEVASAARKLIEENQAVANRMRERYGIGTGEMAKVDEATLNRLRGLGYIN